MGETMAVVRSTEPGGFQISGDAHLSIGGAESNAAIAAARLGVSACWVSRLGDDPVGRRIQRELRAEGVEVRAVIDSAAPTGLLLKDTPRPGVTQITYHRSGSAASRLDESDIERAGLISSDILHLTGITPALSASAARAAVYAADYARSEGARVSFDVNHRSTLWSADRARPLYRSLVSLADVVFAGDDEAALTLDMDCADDPEGLARELASLGPSEVVVKRGHRGAGALVQGVWHQQAAARVAVVDTVGAGDAFVGAYLAGMLLGFDRTARLDLAVRNGAAACTHPGDWEGTGSFDELALGTTEFTLR